MFAGQDITGAEMSATVTLNVQDAWFPAASVAVAVTVVEPMLKTELLAGAYVTIGAAPLLSAAVAGSGYETAMPPGAAELACPAALAGQTMVGLVTSFTLTVKVQDLDRPTISVAVAVTVVTPTGKSELLA